MKKNVRDSVSGALSAIKTPEREKRLGKRKKAPSTSDSQQKNVRFECNSGEKDHVKYVTTPFLSSVKKKKGETNLSVEKSKKVKKLSFDEEKHDESKGKIKNKKKLCLDKRNTSSVSEKLPRKRKLDSDGRKILDKIIAEESQETENKKKKYKTEHPESERTLRNSTSAPDAFANASVNEKERTIFVGNLPLTYDKKKVVKLFNKFGPIQSARIRCVPVANTHIPKKTTAITKKFNPKRKSANAYVIFKSKESVGKAVAENGMVVDGHHLRIDNATTKRKDTNKSIFVGGLPFDVEDDDLWDAFKDCGEIEGVRIVRDNVIGMGKGFGYVNFKSIASVELALKLDGHEIKKRKINVQRCLNKKKKSYEKLASLKTKKGNNNKAKVATAKGGKELSGGDFQGRTAEQKKKKKKNKKSTDTLRKNKMKKVLSSSPAKKVRKDKSKAPKSD